MFRIRRLRPQVAALALVAALVAPGIVGAQDGATPGATPAASAAPTASLGWDDSFAEEDGTLNVASTVAPISSIVRNVGGRGST